jgi:hypothetical protein
MRGFALDRKQKIADSSGFWGHVPMIDVERLALARRSCASRTLILESWVPQKFMKTSLKSDRIKDDMNLDDRGLYHQYSNQLAQCGH